MSKEWYLELEEDSLRMLRFSSITDRVQGYWDYYMKNSHVFSLGKKQMTTEVSEKELQSAPINTRLFANDVRHISTLPFSTLLCLYNMDGKEFAVSKSGYRRVFRQLPFQGHYHTHKYIEFLYVVRGSFEQVLLGEHVCFKEGDFVITDQNISHADFLSGKQDTAVLFLSLQSDYLDQLLAYCSEENPLFSYLFRALRRQQNLQSYLHLENQRHSPYVPIILEQLIAEEYQNMPGASAIIQGSLVRLFSFLCTDYSLQLHESGKEDKEQIFLYELERYIHLHYNNLTSSILEQEFHYHRNYYNLLLKKYVNLSFMDYLIQVRMKAAAQLLTSTNLPIKEISCRVGYQNSSFFYEQFKKQYGKTPKEFRRDFLV